jgi:protein-S-isoprenylcysteine O-methyltransferase Ste14
MMDSAVPLLVLVTAIVALAVTGNLFSASLFVIAAQAVALGLNLWARGSFQQGTFRVSAAPGSRAIIRTGPYRFIRHPMYSAALLFVWAGILSHLSVLPVIIGVAATGLIVARVIAEEKLLRATYPGYLEYMRSTRAIVPYVF